MTQIEEKKMLAEFCGTICIVEADWDFMFSDYNSLMQVLTKISKIKDALIDQTIFNDWLVITISLDGEVIRHSNYDYEEAIYRACVEFVKWWNQQNSKD